MIAWPHQLFALQELPRRILAGERKILLTCPTGGGKSLIMCLLIEWAVAQGWKVILYTNRRLLIDQLARVLTEHGIKFGIRAANHEDNRELPVQISSLPTERARVLKTDKWMIHGRGEKVLAIIDEAHLNGSDTAQKILAMHAEHEGIYVGFTATPIGLGHLYDSLLVAGTVSELRKCGALVKAYHYGPDEPDMKNFKTNMKTGEYSENDVRKAIMTKVIFARVLEYYGKLNPDQRPSILFGPGVKESIWFAEQFTNSGIRAAHIDGEGIWLDGEYRRGDREEVFSGLKAGSIKVLCNRFVLREGLDLPFVSHLILATVMGSLGTYIQSAGRGLRACAGKDALVIQDHGGHWHRHGSVNIDREWTLECTANILKGIREENFREKLEQEPIRCPQCGMIRAEGPKCPKCGHVASVRSRMVMQTDGTLKEHKGDIYKPRVVRMKPNTLELWKNQYYRAKNSKNKMTFRQAEALFFLDNYYYPPHDLPLMPQNKLDWFRSVADVPKERLNQ
jgi:superfamily II DNA or RNA helicase